MALARAHVWNPGDILRSADLNGEFNNILLNPISLLSPTTGQINFNSNQSLNFALENLAAVPAVGTVGRIYFNTARLQAEVTDGTNNSLIVTLPSSTVTRGDLIVGTTGNTFTRLPIGSTGQVLTVTSSNSAPSWQPGAGAAFTVSFESSVIAFTANTVTNVAHGLGGMPKGAMLTLRCQTSAANGYSTGDEWVVVGTLSEGNAANRSGTVAFNATNVTVINGLTIGNHYDKVNGSDFSPLSSVFFYVARVWR